MKISDITYLKVTNKRIVNNIEKAYNYYIFLDYNSDTTIGQSASVTDNPLDAIRGTSLQENRIVDMITVGVSGAFSSRNPGRSLIIPEGTILFLSNTNRIESIVEWFEQAIENKQLFTVCKKGVIYYNQLLNSIDWDFDDSVSKIGVTLSFLEIVTAERADLEASCSVQVPTTTGDNPVSRTSERLAPNDIYETVN